LGLKLYQQVSSQLVVAGMGTVLGINHLAVHEYLKMLQFKGLEYRFLFNKINQLSNLARTTAEKHKPPDKK